MGRIKCNYGICKSQQNNNTRLVNGAPGIRFIKFPSPKTNPEQCLRWVNACCRTNFTILNVTRGTYICSKHFHNFEGPTDEDPDPIPLTNVLDPNLVSMFPSLTPSPTQSLDPQEITPKGKQVHLDLLNYPIIVTEEDKSLDKLNFKTLCPPCGWCMEVLENNGVVFTKYKNKTQVLQCTFSYLNNEAHVTINALEKTIPYEKVSGGLLIKNNGNVYNFLSKMNNFKTCSGNDDKDFLELYKNRRPNKHNTSSHFSESLKSIFSKRCYGLIDINKSRCCACQLYRSSLRTMRLRSKISSIKKTIVPRIKMTKPAVLSQKSKMEIAGLKMLLKEKFKSEPTGSFMSIFIKQQLKALERSKYGMRWDSYFVKWCSYMKNKSKSSYIALKKSNIISLPTTRTLYNHTHTLHNHSGFNEEVINEMVEITKIDTLPDHKKYFILLLDEMSVTPDVVSHKNTGAITGFIDIDDPHNTLGDMEREIKGDTTPPLATHILQLMVRGITSNIKVPFAHFPTKGATSSELYSIIWDAISMLENNGFRILAVVGDGASTNRRFFRICAGSEQRVPFVTPNLHAADEERDIYFLSDAPHLIKTVRNGFSNSGSNSKSRALWKKGEEISWKVILRLYYTQLKMTGEFKHASKLTYGHVFLNCYSKMKVNYAAQVMSETVACAIERLFGINEYKETVKFIRTFNKFFDLCNVKNCNEALRKKKPTKRPYDNINDERLKWLETDFIAYLSEWEDEVGYRPGKYTKAQRDRMLLSRETLEGLRMTAISTVRIVKFLLNKGAKYVLTQHLNQDPLEQYFGRHRSAGGRNCNPSVYLFESNIDKLNSLLGLAVEAVNGNTKISE